MANCSSAFGTMKIRVRGENEDDEKRLLENIKKLFDADTKLGCYSTEISDYEINKDEKGLFMLADFIGTGRWTFEANVRYRYKWFDEMVNNEKWGSEELKKIWEELDRHEWSIEYDFVDEECGLGVLYCMEVGVYHMVGEKDAIEKIHAEANYEYTPENLVKLDVCGDIDEAREYCGLEEGEE